MTKGTSRYGTESRRAAGSTSPRARGASIPSPRTTALSPSQYAGWSTWNAGGEHERVALAPLVQAIELPHPEPDADGRDQERDHQADPIAPVYPHSGLILDLIIGLIARPARARASRRVTA